MSLAEAETIRRIIHGREGLDIIDGAGTSVALRNVTQGGLLMDRSVDFEERAW